MAREFGGQRGQVALVLLQPGGEIAPLRQCHRDALHLEIHDPVGAVVIFPNSESQVDRGTIASRTTVSENSKTR